jgi:hypothetical protein
VRFSVPLHPGNASTFGVVYPHVSMSRTAVAVAMDQINFLNYGHAFALLTSSRWNHNSIGIRQPWGQKQ